MAADGHAGLDRLAALREAFDRSFSMVPAEGGVVEELLDIRLGSAVYALRVTELSGLFRDLQITPLPSGIAELLGITAVRGVMLPVYDLRVLLGYAVGAPPRWAAVASMTPIGLAFDAFDRHVRVGRDAIVHPSGEITPSRHVRHVVRVDGMMRPIISITSIVEAIADRVRAGAPDKE